MISVEKEKQKIFAIIAGLMLVSNIYLASLLWDPSRSNKMVVLVPTIDKEMSVGTKLVSEDYLHYRAEQIMQLLFSIRHENFAYNVDQILKQVSSHNRPEFGKQLDEFTKDIKSKKYFYTFNKDAYEIDASRLEVTFSGYLETFINDKRVKTNHKKYKLAFTNSYGLVKLNSFEEVTGASV